MSILKGILHHWNKTSSAYDTIHPETEVAQVTDWNTGIVNTLASTGLSSLVNVLSSDSLIALLIKKVFDATGVKYSLGQNGYVCWGALFGGVITQWVYALASDQNVGHDFTLPLSCSVHAYSICHNGTSPGAVGIADGKAYDIGWNNTPVWIIAIGSM
ncbi:hypothetical protein LIQ46_07750 [Megasphaera elsdenii]|uniref:hypothetical protein n=1 Tax=Megasphaera elsdenii TaxID=907 RepID=UPI001D0292AC|nr:hypothetical protein [Megasphaera elsdenii]MCB5702781.1 hypothetical protein [Megasphaera elsdenii]MCB5727632.1 hypothetical protein [Megasphaera elsdenii]MCB5771411.1 hypothetical protein [Megasphaera elsdenii]